MLSNQILTLDFVPGQGCASSPKITIYKPETLSKELQQVVDKKAHHNNIIKLKRNSYPEKCGQASVEYLSDFALKHRVQTRQV